MRLTPINSCSCSCLWPASGSCQVCRKEWRVWISLRCTMKPFITWSASLRSPFRCPLLQAGQWVSCSNARLPGPVRSSAVGLSYPPLLLETRLKLFEASGISAQKERRVGEVGAGAGERPLGQLDPSRVWSPLGARGSRPLQQREEAGDLPLRTPSRLDPPSQCRARGLGGKRGRPGSGDALALPLHAPDRSLEAPGGGGRRRWNQCYRVEPHRSALPRATEKDPGALREGVAQGPAVDAGCLQSLCIWDVRHPREPPDWHRRRPAGRAREEVRVVKRWWVVASALGVGVLMVGGVGLRADLRGKCIHSGPFS